MTRAVIFATTMALLLGGCGRDDEPTAISTTGACCDTSGICGVTTEANCAGSWTRAGICEPNPCPLPPPTGMVFKAAGSFIMGSPAGEV